MKKITYLLLFLTFIGVSCSKDFFDINKDPNNPSEATPKLVLPSGITSSAYVVGGWYQLLGGIWAQHWTQSTGASQWTTIEDYALQADDFDTRQFGGLYIGALSDLDYIRTETGKTQDWRYYLIATCVQSYTYQVLADLYDKIPFTEALKGIDNLQPKYDDGALVYDSLISRIDYALNKDFTIKSASNPEATCSPIGAEDIIFPLNDNATDPQQSKLDLWIQFANTLKLKIYLRQVYARPAIAQAGIEALLAENNFLTVDATMTAFKDEQNRRNPIYETGVDRLSGNIAASRTLLKFLSDNIDPRLDAIYAKPSKGGNHVGILPGHYKLDATLYSTIQSLSTPNLKPIDPVYFISAAESYFLQAEAQLRFGTDAQSQALYVMGIQASMSKFGVADKPSLYTGGNYTYPTTTFEDKLAAIITQKWINAANSQSLEAFFDYNRTGYPNDLIISATNVTSGLFPKRLLFPFSETLSNRNTPALVPLTTKVWWDKK